MADQDQDPTRSLIKEQLMAERNAHHKRVRDELEEMEGRVQRLAGFIQSTGFDAVQDPNEQGLIKTQLGYMQQYVNVLKQRREIHKAQP